MNFKKNKDVKRASYYVWFLGAKESKGLRGDEYVTPVLNYLLDNECELEPSKVTLQVSNKGLKIIQILTVPRKSAKLSADQQLQLFANCQPGLRAPGTKGDPGPGGSSVLKTEQVKHHIPHNSITWVYQEEDVICAILLLYNPLTRCPVHVHAYRCDSIETANNLRQQLQTLVDRPENQKKFREIESRLAAKGLLVPPQPAAGYANYHEYSPESGSSSRYHPHHSPTTSKTLNSDGRSTRTEASDENSEESNSSDLGYAIRSKSSHGSGGYKQHAPPPPPPIHSIPTPRSDRMRHQSHSPPRHSEHLFKPKPKSSGKMEKPKRQSVPDEPEVPSGMTAALYDSLAAELRAKLGNPKMGPLLLPPRDYDSSSGAFSKKQAKQQRQKACPLTRSESSGKSSSGIGSDEALAGDMPKRSHYRSDYECDKRYGPQSLGNLPKPYCFGDNEKQLYSLQPPTMYSSEEEDYEPNDRRHTPEVDTEDIEEDVLFTARAQRSKSTYDLRDNFESSKSQERRGREHHVPPPPAAPVSQHAARYYHRQAPPNAYAQHPSPVHEPDRKAKMYASNPNLARDARDSRPPAKEVSRPTAEKLVVGRRELRSSGLSSRPAAQAPPPSKPKSIQKFYFADAEFATESQNQRNSSPRDQPSNLRRQLGRSSGNLANIEYSGPVSLGYHPEPERAVSPPYQYRYEPKSYVPSQSSSSKPSTKPPSSKAIEIDRSRELARKRFEQPYSRFSYIEVDHNRHESRFGLLGALRR